MAQLGGLVPGIFAHTLVDAHVYTAKSDGSMSDYDHVPGLVLQLTRTPRPLPRLRIDPHMRELEDIASLLDVSDTERLLAHFSLEGYDPYPPIRFKVAV
jgi:thymidylate synthase